MSTENVPGGKVPDKKADDAVLNAFSQSFDSDSEFYREGEPPTVAEFIDGTLYDDEIEFSNTAYARTYEKYFELYGQGLEQDKISVRMMSDPDDAIREVSRRMIQEKHLLTVGKFEASLTKESTALPVFVPKALLAYNRARVEKELKELTKALRSLAPDDGKVPELMERIMKQNNLKRILTTKLGRV